MQVKDERKVKTISFGTIECGEVFTDKDGDFMMRTEDLVDVYESGCKDTYKDTYNAVNLVTGAMHAFSESRPVIRINRAALTIYE